jgi:hypothetical protein
MIEPLETHRNNERRLLVTVTPFVGSRTGGYKPKGVIKESGIAAHASVRGQNMLAGVPDVVLTNDCLMQ